MISYKRRSFRSVFNVSSPPGLAHFVKPVLSVSKPAKAKMLAPALTTHAASYRAFTVHDLPGRLELAPALKAYDTSAHSEPAPTISVIIPMYNSEQYIDACLDSILNQTFQDFEVIVVDDCSKDLSYTIVKRYIPTFNGRLRLAQTEKNMGSGSIPRNIGLSLARGEYVYNMDNDDLITPTALEEMYTLAKEYDADVVYCERYYETDENLENVRLTSFHSKGNLVNKPTFESENLSDRVMKILQIRFFVTPWTKLIKRDLLMDNQILFPNIIRDDTIWTWNLIFHAKRILRVPNAVYMWRNVSTSITRVEKTPAQVVTFWLNPVILGVKTLDEILSQMEFFQENPQDRYALLERFILGSFNIIAELDSCRQMERADMFKVLKETFATALDKYDLLIPALCTLLFSEKTAHVDAMQVAKKFSRNFTARIDIKLLTTTGTFQILDVSDTKAKITQPGFLQTDAVGYMITSYAGDLKFTAKATVDGRINMNLRGMDIRDTADISKRVPCWIDYTSFRINGKTLFDTVTPVWLLKPYTYNMNVKAGEEVTVQLSWLPHKESPTAISVIIPLYNAEKYVGECLDSILAQTFKNFEVIIVDDCSTDNSVAIVESYKPKFEGRLILSHMSTNSGSPGDPTNMGIELSRGEYLFIMDDDDALTPDALEKLYTVAKDFDADVVTVEKFYDVPEESWHDAEFRKNLKPWSYQRGTDFVDKPTLIPFDVAQRVEDCYEQRFLGSLWQKLIRRDYLIENEIRCPNAINMDYLITCLLAYTAKRFVRVPYAINFYRVRENSLFHLKREPLPKLKKYLNALNSGFNYLDAFLSKRKFFQENPALRYTALSNYFRRIWNLYIKEVYTQVPPHECEDAIQKEFAGSSNKVLTTLLLSALTEISNTLETTVQLTKKINRRFTARIDIKFMTAKGDFQILDVSDAEAKVTQPAFLQGGGTGHMITSCAGELKFTAKASVDGRIEMNLRGMDIRDPADNSKRIPCWIDYISLRVNGKTLFDTVTPVWLLKPYFHKINVKAGEEVTVQVSWLPHSETLSTIINAPQVPDKFKDYLTARADIKLRPKSGKGDFPIVSMSDSKAGVTKPRDFQKDGVGYVIESYVGKLEFIAKAEIDGSVRLNLRGVPRADPADKAKRIPYWIDYTRLVINGKTIFDKLTSVWHDKPYSYSMNVKAGEEVQVQVEWLPHRDNASNEKQGLNTEQLRKSEALIAELNTALSNEKQAADKQKALVSELRNELANEKKDHKADAALISKFKDYFTGRADVKLVPKEGTGDLQVVSVSDNAAKVEKPKWFQKDGVGYVIQSHCGELEFVVKTEVDGQICLILRGRDVKDKADKSKRVPYWIDYTSLRINGKTLFNAVTPVWYNKPYRQDIDVKAGDEVKIQLKWLPHRSDA